MSELRFIVDRLNKPPFQLGLSMVALDEKTNFELIELLNDILKKLDPKTHGVDARNETDEVRVYRWVEFLQMMRFGFPQDVDAFRENISRGERNTIYPILYWMLSKFPQLEKRAYLARFLANIECPAEFLQDEALGELYEHYTHLKTEFKTVHKQLDQLKAKGTQPQELKSQVTQLEEEKKQLINKINSTKKKVADQAGFQDLLEVTQKLRLAQEEEMKLMEREREQVAHLQMVERRYAEIQMKLREVQAGSNGDVTAEQLLQQLEKEVAANKQTVEVELPFDIKTNMSRLNEVQGQLGSAPRTEQEVDDLRGMESQLSREIDQLNQQIQQAQKEGGDSKLAMFRQQAQLINKKVAKKEAAFDEAQQLRTKLLKEIEEKDALMSELQGPKFMKRDEFKNFATKLRNKTNQYKKMKAELAEIRAETVVLNRTEQLLRGRDGNLSDFLAKQEAKAGVQGYHDTEKKLQSVSEKQGDINQAKGKTLDEISKIVTDINQTLKERKNKLAPQIKELRAVRQRYQEVEQDHLEKKALYENTAAGLETERIKLEQECAAFQEDCLREESRYHYLQCMMRIAEAHHERVEQEVEYDRGHGRLLRDFRTYKELYQHKISQQEGLAKELRKRQKHLKESEGDNLGQRQMFADMRKLLAAKVAAKDKEARQNNQTQNAGSAETDSLMMDINGANVMTIS